LLPQKIHPVILTKQRTYALFSAPANRIDPSPQKTPLRMTTLNRSAENPCSFVTKKLIALAQRFPTNLARTIGLHQLNSTNETLSPGMGKSRRTAPSLLSTHRGDSSSCNCPAAFKDWDCSAVGDRGDPIAFHTV
jgi:hypothetical protein